MACANAAAKAYRAGQAAMARGDYQLALSSFMWASTLEPDMAMFLHATAGAFKKLGDYHEAEQLYRKSVDIAESTLSVGHPLVAVAAYNLVELYETQERFEEAQTLSTRVTGALDQSEAIQTNNRNLPRLAHLLVRANRRADGEKLLRKALADRKKTFGADSSNAASCRAALWKFLAIAPARRKSLAPPNGRAVEKATAS